MTGRDLILAVDGGQTSTKSIIATREGEVLGRGTGTPCDHLHGPNGYQRNRDAIHSAALAALAAADRSAHDIVGVGLGLTSAARENNASMAFREMVEELCSPEAFWVDADFVSNLAGASAGKPGIVVIAGGGSIGYGIDGAGREAISGGLGFLMGDDGSGWYLGLNAIQAATRASDQRGPATALLPFVLEHYELGSIRDIIRIIYATGFSRDRIATIAPEVVRIAAEGDAVAQDIVQGAAEGLADIAMGVARQLNAPGDAITIYPTGGVFAGGNLIKVPFEERILAGWPTARIAPPQFPPAVGGLIQVWKALGDPISEERLSRVRASLH